MKWLRTYMSRKYWFKMLISIGMLSIVVVILSSAVLFYKSQNTLLDIQHESNRKMLDQVAYNIDFTDRMLNNLITTTFIDMRTSYLLDTVDPEEYKLYPSIMSFSKIINSIPMLDSIMVYNSRNGCFYYYSETKVLNCKEDGMNGLMDNYVRNTATVPRLQLIPIYYSETDRRISHFSYFMYSNLSGSLFGSNSSALIFNIKPDWLFSNISEINQLTDFRDSELLIVDSKGSIVNDLAGNGAWNELWTRIERERQSNGTAPYSFIDKSEGTPHLITYVSSGNADWTIVSVQPYDAVVQLIGELKTFTIMVVAIVLLLTAISSVVLASRLYNPISGVLKQIRKSFSQDEAPAVGKRDEFGIISTVLEETMSEMQALRQEQDSQSGILRGYYVRQLLLDSPHVTPSDALAHMQIPLKDNTLFSVCLFLLDEYDNLAGKYSAEERQQVMSSFGSKVEEVVCAAFPADCIDVGSGHLAVLLYSELLAHELMEQICSLAAVVQEAVTRDRDLSVTVVCSDPVDDYMHISSQYMKAKEYAKYKFVYGKRAIIVPERVRANEEYEWQGFPPELEKKWLASIRTSDSEEGPKYLDELFATIGRCNYDQIIHSLLSLVAAATHALPVMAGSSSAIDLRSVYRHIFEKETLEDVYELFVSLFHLSQQEEHRHMSENTKRQLLVNTIKEIVDAKYTDADLCLQSIADMVNLSSSYVGKQFRDQEDLSVAKYITAVRMERAAKLLRETDDSVNAVMEKVGFLNQSYFFKLFKQHFNVTPNEFKSAHYRLNG